jgi:hypothetical protein
MQSQEFDSAVLSILLCFQLVVFHMVRSVVQHQDLDTQQVADSWEEGKALAEYGSIRQKCLKGG